MGTLLAMILSMSMMTGCGHATKTATTVNVPVTAPSVSDDAGIEPRSTAAEPAAIPIVQGPPPLPRATSARRSPAPRRSLKDAGRPSGKRWVPEPVAPQQYFNSGGLPPHNSLMGWRR